MNQHTTPTMTIEAGKSERNYWADLWRYRELFYVLAWRDISVRYKQTVIGILWAVLRPIFTMVIFVFVFGKIAQLPSEGIPYPIFVFAAILPWTFFSTAFSDASGSLIGSANLISKIYFPRLIIPASAVVVACVDFLISLSILAILMLIYKQPLSFELLALPLFLILGFLTALGAGLFISALNVKYRDFRFIIPFTIQLGLYASPVGFSSSIVPEAYRLLYYLNPMVAVIDGFRWSITGGKTAFNMTELYISISMVCVLLVLGIWKFRSTEKTFADVI